MEINKTGNANSGHQFKAYKVSAKKKEAESPLRSQDIKDEVKLGKTNTSGIQKEIASLKREATKKILQAKIQLAGDSVMASAGLLLGAIGMVPAIGMPPVALVLLPLLGVSIMETERGDDNTVSTYLAGKKLENQANSLNKLITAGEPAS
ncbi:MAG: hypothetical protein M1536_06730 [Firmicutes bacterium]|nr:hypothetical protein [Bacillota bacterium]